MTTQPFQFDSSACVLRFAVIGAGITGLAAAHRLIEQARAAGRLIQVVVFEATDRVGGVFGTEARGDYLIERGADSFITNKPWGIDLCRRLGLQSRLIPTNAEFRRSLILYQGRPVPTPAGFQLVAPTQVAPILTTPLLSWAGKLRLLSERLIPARTETGDESVADFVTRRLGKEALTRLVQPLVGGIYTGDPERLSAQATLERFVAMERNSGSLFHGMKAARTARQPGHSSGARYDLFVSFPDGIQELLRALEQAIQPEGGVCWNSPVTRVEKRPQGWAVHASRSCQEFSGVVLALPVPAAAQLVRPLDAVCADLLQSIELASSAIVVSGHSLQDVGHPLDAFGLVIPHAEKRRILATSFLSRKFEHRAPPGRVCLRTFVGGALQPEMLTLSDAEILKIVREELRSILGVRGMPDFAEVFRYPLAMPQYTVGHLKRVNQIRQRAAQISGLELSGNYLDGVGVPDCIHSGEQAAEQLWSGGPASGGFRAGK